MQKSKGMISKDEALRMVQLALNRTALIFHHFSQTLIEEMGEEKGSECLRNAHRSEGQTKGRVKKFRGISRKLRERSSGYCLETERVLVEGGERESSLLPSSQ